MDEKQDKLRYAWMIVALTWEIISIAQKYSRGNEKFEELIFQQTYK